jgi:putative ABC transport system permease protein
MMQRDTVIRLQDVRFRWPGQQRDILDIPELTLNAGERLLIRGSSGSGKTTLLNLITGINLPDAGSIQVLDTLLERLSAIKRDQFRADHLGVIFQQFNLLLSMLLLLGVDKIRKEAKTSFLNTISQTDLIVGARSGSINLLLYSVFRIGNATNNVSYESYQDIAGMKGVKWTVPISLGDSHRGFRVMGTDRNYFTYYRYGNNRPLELKSGMIFKDVYDAVIGSDVAQKLNYKVNDKIIVSHGLISGTFSEHDDKPFRIAGILKKTGTSVDRTVHVSLQGIEAIHIDWQSGTRSPLKISAEQARKMNLQPKTITAFMLGLENKIDTFRLQRKINEYVEEPLLAILPGATLAMLWQTIGNFEKILLAVSGLALMTGLFAKYQSRIDSLQDDSEEAWQLYQTIQEEMANAPLNEKLNEQWIKLPGFIAPIKHKGTLITEFLLVPYFGACIHVPPPPVNQIVFVKTAQGHGIETYAAFQAFWVMGQISVQRKKTNVGEAGYRISEATIAPYENEFLL